MRGADETRYVHRGVAVDEAFPATGPPGAESERPPRVCVCNESVSSSLSLTGLPRLTGERASERGLASALVCVHSSAWPRPPSLSPLSRKPSPLS